MATDNDAYVRRILDDRRSVRAERDRLAEVEEHLCEEKLRLHDQIDALRVENDRLRRELALQYGKTIK